MICTCELCCHFGIKRMRIRATEGNLKIRSAESIALNPDLRQFYKMKRWARQRKDYFEGNFGGTAGWCVFWNAHKFLNFTSRFRLAKATILRSYGTHDESGWNHLNKSAWIPITWHTYEKFTTSSPYCKLSMEETLMNLTRLTRTFRYKMMHRCVK